MFLWRDKKNSNIFFVNPSLVEHDMPCLSEQCRSIKYVNFYQKPRSSNLTGWKLEMGVASFVCVGVLRPSQPNGVMSSAVSLPNHTFTGQA